MYNIHSFYAGCLWNCIGKSKMVFVGEVVDLRWRKAAVRRIKIGNMVATTPQTRRGAAVFECTQSIRGVKVGQRVTLDVLKDICEFGSYSYLTEPMVRKQMFKNIQIKIFKRIAWEDQVATLRKQVGQGQINSAHGSMEIDRAKQLGTHGHEPHDRIHAPIVDRQALRGKKAVVQQAVEVE